MKYHFLSLGTPLILLLLILVSCQPEKQTGIIFASMRSGNWELYRLNQENNKTTNLSRYPASERFPDSSPDGSKLAFVSDRDGSLNIYQMDFTGNNLITLAQSPFTDKSPRWSPKGDQLVFVSERFERNENIYLLDLKQKDQEPQRLNHDQAPDYDPSWFPDGQSILFISQREGKSEIFQLKLKSPQKRVQLTQDGREKRYPEVSPDGKQIAYAVSDGTDWELEVLNLENQQKSSLIKGQKWLGHPRWIRSDTLILSLYQNGLFQIEEVNLKGQRNPIETGSGDAREMTLFQTEKTESNEL